MFDDDNNFAHREKKRDKIKVFSSSCCVTHKSSDMQECVNDIDIYIYFS